MAHVTIQNQLLHEIEAHLVDVEEPREPFVCIATKFTNLDGGRFTEILQAFVPLDVVQLTHWAEQCESAASDLRALVRKVTADEFNGDVVEVA